MYQPLVRCLSEGSYLSRNECPLTIFVMYELMVKTTGQLNTSNNDNNSKNGKRETIITEMDCDKNSATKIQKSSIK